MPYKSTPADLARDWNATLATSTRDLLVPVDCRYCPSFNAAGVRCKVFTKFLLDCPWIKQYRREEGSKTP